VVALATLHCTQQSVTLDAVAFSPLNRLHANNYNTVLIIIIIIIMTCALVLQFIDKTD